MLKDFTIYVNIENISNKPNSDEIKEYMIQNNIMVEEDFKENVKMVCLQNINSGHNHLKRVLDDFTPVDDKTATLLYSKTLDYMYNALGVVYRVGIVDDTHQMRMYCGRPEIKELSSGQLKSILDYDADIYICMELEGSVLLNCYSRGNIVKP